MLLELARKINKQSNGEFSLMVDVDGNVYTLGVYSDIGIIYSMSSTSVEECYERVNKFIDSFDDDDKFESFIKEVVNEKFEVANDR